MRRKISFMKELRFIESRLFCSPTNFVNLFGKASQHLNIKQITQIPNVMTFRIKKVVYWPMSRTKNAIVRRLYLQENEIVWSWLVYYIFTRA